MKKKINLYFWISQTAGWTLIGILNVLVQILSGVPTSLLIFNCTWDFIGRISNHVLLMTSVHAAKS